MSPLRASSTRSGARPRACWADCLPGRGCRCWILRGGGSREGTWSAVWRREPTWVVGGLEWRWRLAKTGEGGREEQVMPGAELRAADELARTKEQRLDEGGREGKGLT